MRRVLVETGIDAPPSRCRRYQFTCLKNSLEVHSESPMTITLPHTLVFDLSVPAKDLIATEHALNWLPGVEAVVLYVDLGMSPRMIALRDAAEKQKVPVELRTIEFQACE